MSKKHLRILKETIDFHHKVLGEDYFINSFDNQPDINSTKEEKLNTISNLSKALLKSEMFCAIQSNQTHYLTTVDLFMSASYEKEHRKTILYKEIILKLKNFSNFLDIGVGKGELTKFIGQYFKNITAVDNSLESLSKLPDYINSNNSIVNKLHGSILDINLSDIKFDFILISHTLYYITDKYRVPLFEKLHNLLNEDGIISVVYNDGLSREQLVQAFNGRKDDFNHFYFKIMSTYKNSYALTSTEIMESKFIEPMLHVANMIIHDASGNATLNVLSDYLNNNCFYEDIYQIDMNQNFIFVGKSYYHEND